MFIYSMSMHSKFLKQMCVGLAACLTAFLFAQSLTHGQEIAAPVKVTIKDGPLITTELALDPSPYIEPRYQNGMMMGLTVDGARITCTAENSIYPRIRIDNQEFQPGFDPNTGQPSQVQPLPPEPSGKKRLGSQSKWSFNNVHLTQVVEIVPSEAVGLVTPGPKRRLDTVRISYLIENKDSRNHTVEFRTFVDTLINTNDGALFAAPTTAPGEILDGVMLQDKKLPKYLHVLEHPDLKKPGQVATMTLKFDGKAEGPIKAALTNTAAFNFGAWDVQVQKAGGDSACCLYWSGKNMKPGEKRHLIWGYGGGLAGNPEGEGKVTLAMGGSFEPGKQFTVLATVDDPVQGQTLTLELPAGMERLEGQERQPVPAVGQSSVVLWKARVLRTGEFEVKVRSSTGTTHVKSIRIEKAAESSRTSAAQEASTIGESKAMARNVHYSGRVQGVGFRDTAVMIARNHPVTGWVKNLPDGRVQLVVEGEGEAVQKFLAAVRERWKKNIEKEESEETKVTGSYKGFTVMR